MNKELYNIIERLANLLRQEVRAEGQALGLQPIQQEALYYLSICNRYSDTTLAVTEYLGLTKGTVSQTLKVLENKNLMLRKRDIVDKRVVHLELTVQGRTFLEQISPPPKFTKALELLTDKIQSDTELLLLDVLKSYQITTNRTAFGVCNYCKYNQKSGEKIKCGLTKEILSKNDTTLICREYSEEAR